MAYTAENIEFGIHNKMSKNEKKKLVEEHIKLVGLEEFEKAYPMQLSGGMQQRASIARTLINKSEMIRKMVDVDIEKPRSRNGIRFNNIKKEIFNEFFWENDYNEIDKKLFDLYDLAYIIKYVINLTYRKKRII